MQDILDRKYSPIDDDSDDEDSEDSEDEEPVPARENSNYTKAEEELLRLALRIMEKEEISPHI